MIRRLIGGVAGPMMAACVAGVARLANGHRLRGLTDRERRELEGVVPGVDLAAVRLAEGCRLPLLPGFVAITLGSSIYLRERLSRCSPTLLAHELVHVRQFTQRGWMGMTGAYATLWMQHGYAEHPLELEAQAAERKFLGGRRAADATMVRAG